ncbi:DUF2388 domain-containing protein [Pseudomonas sp. NFIX28]|uniref:DUF2388 domain-containing protein n=1 Tax=Pseudomonas sp. NFIX28 TaxID=1566235 RepID=UPI000897FFB6|nr:DUF2388 domain-containing protein [Pseudomonas sp. NFIX28]SDZ62887.1 conserverd hypothetical protein [Pseudomonas sp. NFIX28]
MTTCKIRLPFLMCSCLFANLAQATSLVISTDITMSLALSTTEGSSKATSSFKDDKLVLAARSDAATFVASAGDIRGAQLEAALQHIRQVLGDSPYSDLQLASAILTL